MIKPNFLRGVSNELELSLLQVILISHGGILLKKWYNILLILIRLGISPPTLKSMSKKKKETSLFVKLTRRSNDLIYMVMFFSFLTWIGYVIFW